MGLITSILVLLVGWSIVFILGCKMSREHPFRTDGDAIERWACQNFSEPYIPIAVTSISILISQVGIPVYELSPDTKFFDVNVYDYFDAGRYMSALEVEFGLMISEEDAEKIKSINDLVIYLHSRNVRIKL
jgi:acyl carrier protein